MLNYYLYTSWSTEYIHIIAWINVGNDYTTFGSAHIDYLVIVIITSVLYTSIFYMVFPIFSACLSVNIYYDLKLFPIKLNLLF